jgi:hypothetical protein
MAKESYENSLTLQFLKHSVRKRVLYCENQLKKVLKRNILPKKLKKPKLIHSENHWSSNLGR